MYLCENLIFNSN